MYCSRCGSRLVPDAAFCAKCGAPVVQPPAPAAPVPTMAPLPAPPLAPPPVAAPPPVMAAPPPPFRPGPASVFAAPSAASSAVVIKRPGVVTLLAVLQLISAAFWLLGGLGSMAGSLAGTAPDAPFAAFMALFLIAIGAAQLFCGIGLLKLKPYGRTIQLAFAWIGLIAIPLGTIISVLILIYLFKPGIKLIFAGRPGDDFTEQEIAEIKNDTATSGASTVIIVVVCVILAIAFLGIVAAIVVPGLNRARMAGNEVSAISSLSAIHSAEITYASNCAQGGFAVALEDLAKPPLTGGAAFILPDLARNGVVKSGYIITVARDRSPIAGDVGTAAGTCNGSANQPAGSFFASAEPAQPGISGMRYFATDARGTIWESAQPISNPIMNSPAITPVR